MKLISWNVNGIRAILKKGFLDFIATENPDILCLQETKAHPEQVDLQLSEYHHYWLSAEKKGYSGTAIFSKNKPLSVHYGMEIKESLSEGRVITAEFPQFFLVNVYTPNSQDGLARQDFRTKKWDLAFLQHLISLEKHKPVITCGDFNVAHKEIDLARPKANVNNAGFTPAERQQFDQIISHGFVDTFRHFDQSPEKYSWWSYRANARTKNIGWRIDYFLISSSLLDQLTKAMIYPQIMGSDHCPVGIEIAF